MPAETIYSLLVARGESNPEDTAVFAPGRAALTYGALCRQLDSIAGQLDSAAIRRGDRVALVLPNGPELLTVFSAVASCAQAAPLNPALSFGEFDAILRELKISLVITSAANRSSVREAAERCGIPLLDLSFVPGAPAGLFSLAGHKPALDPALARMAAVPDDVALALCTSGTTSRPKIVPCTHAQLVAGARLTIDALHLTAEDRYLCVMPLYHTHALITSLAALIAGGAVIATPPFDAEAFFHWLDEFQPTWYSSAPAIHQAILARCGDHRAIAARSSLRFIRSSAASLPPAVMAELEKVFRAPVIEAYGMTETCLYATSNPLPPLKRKIGSVGIAVGVELAILDGNKKPLPAMQPGEIVLRGPNLITTYENNPAASTDAFVNGWFHTGDRGYLDQDGYLYVTGRLKEIINRGGEKIAPAEVEELLGKHPEVAAAVVFPVPHPSLGEDVAAAVVLRESSSSTIADIRRYAAARLANHKVPSQIVPVDAIPTSSTGKIARARLAQVFAERLKTEFIEPRNLDESRLAKIWQEVLNLPSVSINDNFFALGGDSLKATRVVNRMRDWHQVGISLQHFLVAPTIAALVQELSTGLHGSPDSGLIRVAHSREPQRLFVQGNEPLEKHRAARAKRMELSLFFFSADGAGAHDNKYRLFLESVQFADRNGFTAVWTPERHFHPFGGLYPNPAILGATAAALTKQIAIRAGSVVIPLQNPLRVVEEWSVIDNLSGGRVGIACASGWQVNDFVLAPEHYEDRHEKMIENIAIIQKLWRGEPVLLPNGVGKPTEVRIYPRPVQPELPIWLAAHRDSTFIRAGELGANVLTVLWDTQVEDVARKIELYRKSRAQRGLDPSLGKVTLMLHTYVGDTEAMVRERVKPAYEDYLFVNLGLQYEQLRGVDGESRGGDSDTRVMIDRATEELFRNRGLVGTPEFCLEKLASLQKIGVDEVACLIDFGISIEATLRSVEKLRDIQLAFNAPDE